MCPLWGPLHGGASEACVNMLEQIVADGCDVTKFVNMAKDKQSGFRLMGFGHRVYKNHDPRARIIKSCRRHRRQHQQLVLRSTETDSGDRYISVRREWNVSRPGRRVAYDIEASRSAL